MLGLQTSCPKETAHFSMAFNGWSLRQLILAGQTGPIVLTNTQGVKLCALRVLSLSAIELLYLSIRVINLKRFEINTVWYVKV